jgi:hypothetical protein
MRKLIFPTLCITSTLYLASCNCGGSDEIITTTGIEMTTPANYSAASSMPAIEVQGITVTEKGDRKCHYKNLVTSYRNPLRTSTVKIYADKELKLRTVTIPAGGNLLQYKQLDISGYDTSYRNFSHCTIYFGKLIDTNTFKGQYRFYVQASTDNNGIFRDSSDMVIQ